MNRRPRAMGSRSWCCSPFSPESEWRVWVFFFLPRKGGGQARRRGVFFFFLAVSVFCSQATKRAAPAKMQRYFFIVCGLSDLSVTAESNGHTILALSMRRLCHFRP